MGWIFDENLRHLGIILEWLLEAFQGVKREEITEATHTESTKRNTNIQNREIHGERGGGRAQRGRTPHHMVRSCSSPWSWEFDMCWRVVRVSSFLAGLSLWVPTCGHLYFK